MKRTIATDPFLMAAIAEAQKGLDEGGIPIGSVLVFNNEIIGRGHNQRIQKGSPVFHGEMAALEDAGRLSASVYKACTIYTTLSPCSMCSGAIVLYQIPKVVIGENQTFLGEEEWLRSKGILLEVVNSQECISLMTEFIKSNPKLWDEDIGE